MKILKFAKKFMLCSEKKMYIRLQLIDEVWNRKSNFQQSIHCHYHHFTIMYYVLILLLKFEYHFEISWLNE